MRYPVSGIENTIPSSRDVKYRLLGLGIFLGSTIGLVFFSTESWMYSVLYMVYGFFVFLETFLNIVTFPIACCNYSYLQLKRRGLNIWPWYVDDIYDFVIGCLLLYGDFLVLGICYLVAMTVQKYTLRSEFVERKSRASVS